MAGHPLRGTTRPPSREHRNGVTIVRASGTTFDPKRFAGRAANYITYFLSAMIAGLRVSRPESK